jgi:DMSO/TMAO reductase YedYZ molybdopterin-dependent catalytic subunit
MTKRVRANLHMKIIYLFLLISAILVVASGCVSEKKGPGIYGNQTENLSYQGKSLTPISEQQTRDIKGTQNIDRESYRLQVEGLVKNPRNFTYEEITELPETSKIVDLNCVEGWSFTAKWIVRIELSNSPYRGYWEQRGYNNTANLGGPEFERTG